MTPTRPVTSRSLNVVRSFERRLERLFEGVVGKVFSGSLHPSEIAGKLAREADFARFEHETGPATANSYTILVNPRDLTLDPGELERVLAEEVDRYTADQGLRLQGPISVAIETNKDVSPGTVVCQAEVEPGPTVPWARLVGSDMVEVGRNRALIGRSPEADIVLPYQDISRQHAVFWRQDGQVWIRDLGSSNGTSLDGQPVGREAMAVNPGAVLGFSDHRYRFAEL
jgi:FHA domain-containing protein